MKKIEQLSKDEMIESMFGIPVGTPESWYEEQLKRSEIKWTKSLDIEVKYNLGSGDILREKGSSVTDEYIKIQSKQLVDVVRTNEFKSRGYKTVWISDFRDYFEWIADEKDVNYYKDGEWKWKKDGKEKYKLLVELNMNSKNHDDGKSI